ncbi:hypothetical protein ACFY3M_52120, partial [Streptomyces mirabilis]|uniref:hypothetical protein n=1 Tax=Streptomyces mirabilis TaxID=68239 RepID=UPI0036C2EFD2
DATESEEDELEMLVETWSDDGVALVLDEEAGRHCPACRTDLRQYPTLRETLFGRRQRSK